MWRPAVLTASRPPPGCENFSAPANEHTLTADPASVGALAVEVDQDFAGLGAVAGADEAAVFQLIHDARGAAIAETQASLQQRDAGFLFAADDLDALLDDLF